MVIDSSPTGDPLLDRTLARIAGEQTAADSRTWIETLSAEEASAEQAATVRATALDRLVERGVLERREEKFLWVFRSRRYPTIDGKGRAGGEEAHRGCAVHGRDPRPQGRGADLPRRQLQHPADDLLEAGNRPCRGAHRAASQDGPDRTRDGRRHRRHRAGNRDRGGATPSRPPGRPVSKSALRRRGATGKSATPALAQIDLEAELVQRSGHGVVHDLVNRSRLRCRRPARAEGLDTPSRASFSMFSRWIALSGVSRTMRTSGRRSLIMTSARPVDQVLAEPAGDRRKASRRTRRDRHAVDGSPSPTT